MSERTYATIDKSSWGEGAWQDEPDKVQFIDEATGMPCLAVRQAHSGHWCGYVGVHSEHPLRGRSYDDEAVYSLEVHGGITFAGGCSPGDEATSVCHVPEPGEPDDVWWLGFDCMHAWDLSPAMAARYPDLQDAETRYKTLGFVRDECAHLASQLAAVHPTDLQVSPA